jgi:hypothetical protein
MKGEREKNSLLEIASKQAIHQNSF